MEPGHLFEVKQVLKCLAVQKCRDLIRILLRLTGISDFQAGEGAARKANSRIPARGMGSCAAFL